MAYAYFSATDGEQVTGWHDALADADDELIALLGFNPFTDRVTHAYSKYVLEIRN